jgi:hypothetical protein
MQVIDKRVIERQIRKGKLDAAAYRRTLEGLPDVSDRVARETDSEPIRREISPAAVSNEPQRAPDATPEPRATEAASPDAAAPTY